MASKNYVYELYGKILSLDIAQSCIAALLNLALTSDVGFMITRPSEMLCWVKHASTRIVDCILRWLFGICNLLQPLNLLMHVLSSHRAVGIAHTHTP